MGAHGPLLSTWWYLDDGVLAGPPPVVVQAVEYLKVGLGTLGLSLNEGKCLPWSPNARVRPPEELDAFRKPATTEGVAIRSTPIGGPKFVHEALTGSLRKLDFLWNECWASAMPRQPLRC